MAYAFCALTDCERNYAPLELECLAIVFATTKFDQYVFGHPDVTIHTDHRPLEAILHRSLLRAPKRLQAMILSLQRYTLKVVYKPGTEQVIADMLSRGLSKDGGKGTLAHEHGFQMEAQEEVLRRFNIPDPTSDKYVSDARYQAIRQDTPTDQTLKRVAEVMVSRVASVHRSVAAVGSPLLDMTGRVDDPGWDSVQGDSDRHSQVITTRCDRQIAFQPPRNSCHTTPCQKCSVLEDDGRGHQAFHRKLQSLPEGCTRAVQ